MKGIKTMKNILIVDDSIFVRCSLRKILEKNEFTVIGEAENGLQAVELYKTLKPDIVTMDITMPELSGIEALKQIKSLDKNARVIMISAIGHEASVREAIINGAIAFIIKPFKEELVVKAFS